MTSREHQREGDETPTNVERSLLPLDAGALWPEGSPAALAWREAGEAFGHRLDAQRVARLRPGAADLGLLNALALDHENLPAVVIALGLSRRIDTAERGELAWWPDSAGSVMLLAEADAGGAVAIDIGTGAWRALPLGGPHGPDLIDLAIYRLHLDRWPAARLLARACRLPRVSEVPMARRAA